MKYTDEERAFLKETVPGHSHREIAELFTEKFRPITVSQIKGCIGNYKLNTGRTGRFEKGHVPANKGMRGMHISPETEFKKGHVPANYRPIGSERINADGYVEIKVADPNKWKPKHRVMWEERYGTIPKGHVLIFKNSDKLDTRIENLALIERKTQLRMNQNKLYFTDAELTEAGYNLAKLLTVIGEKKRSSGRKRERGDKG